MKIWDNLTPYDPVDITFKCPGCGSMAVFDRVGVSDLLGQERVEVPDGSGGITIKNSVVNICIGLRVCPNRSCRQVVFFEFDERRNVINSFPFSRLSVDTTNIPESIKMTFEEALDCHAARCWVAAAIMTRKVLEEICDDAGVTGRTLFDRIEALKGRVVLPPELLDGMHEIRGLGNDAAHIELNEFDNVGEQEVTIALEVVERIVESLYQSKDLVDRLKALKKPPPTT